VGTCLNIATNSKTVDTVSCQYLGCVVVEPRHGRLSRTCRQLTRLATLFSGTVLDLRSKFSLAVGVMMLLLAAQVQSDAIDAVQFKDEPTRLRFHHLIDELRCPKCQNQNLADSNSQIAIDLRREVARLVKEGGSDNDIKAFMVDRYGDFVLYRPPLQSNTLVLWWGPVGMLAIGLLVYLLILLGKRKQVDDYDSATGAAEENHEEPNALSADDFSNDKQKNQNNK